MRDFFKWIIVYVPATVSCLIVFFLSTGIGLLGGLGGGNFDTFSTLWFILVLGAFVFPLLILSFSSLIFLKITKKSNMQTKKKKILAFFWIPLIFIYYLVFLAPSLLVWLVPIIVISVIIVCVRNMRF